MVKDISRDNFLSLWLSHEVPEKILNEIINYFYKPVAIAFISG